MKFSVNIDPSFLEETRRKYKPESLPENDENKENNNFAASTSSGNVSAHQKAPASEAPVLGTVSMQNNASVANQQQAPEQDDENDNKFATSNLLMEAIHQTKIKQKQNRLHLRKLQNTIEDAMASHLNDQIELVNSYAPNFKTPKYNCQQQYKGLQDCYASSNGAHRCENIFKDFMRCYRDTRRQYFELKEL